MMVSNLNAARPSINDIVHLTVLISAQFPHADPIMRKAFLDVNERLVDAGHDPLPLLKCGSLSDITGKVPKTDTLFTTSAMPESDDDRPTVRFRRMSPDTYQLDRHNTNLLCKFHEYHAPSGSKFEELGVQAIVRDMRYAHIGGGFRITHFRGGDSLVAIVNPFTIESFIPIRVEVE